MVTKNMLRKVLSLSVALLLIGVISYVGVQRFQDSHAATGGSIYVTPASGALTAGQTTSITVNEDSGSTAVNSVQFSLTYDTAKLQYVSIAEGGAFPVVLQTSTSTAGFVRVARGTDTGTTVSGVHPVVTVNFKVLANSGTTALSFEADKSGQAADGVNITQNLTGGTYSLQGTPTPPPGPTPGPGPAPSPTPAPGFSKNAALSLNPSNGNFAPGDTVTVNILISSPTQGVYSIEPILTYPTTLLQYVSTSNSAAFPTASRTKDSSGTLDLIRGINPGDAGFKGTGTVATVTFKITGSSGTASVGVSSNSGVFDANGNNLLLTRSGAAYGINAASTPPPPPPAGNPSPAPGPAPAPQPSPGSSTKPRVYSGNISYTSTNTGNASLSGDSTQVQGSVDIQPVVNPDILAQNPGDSIVKVEYYLGKSLVATKSSAPFTYNFDTKKLKNGTYSMVIRTYYSSGTVDTTSNKLLVKNPVTLSYVLTHYATDILATFIGLVIVALVIWKFIWPRFGGGLAAAGAGGYDSGLGIDGTGSYAPTETSYEAPEPPVIAPAAPSQDSSVITPDQAAAAQETQALAIPAPQDPAAANTVTEFKPDSYGLPAESQPGSTKTPSPTPQSVSAEQPGTTVPPQRPNPGTPRPPEASQDPGDRHLY